MEANTETVFEYRGVKITIFYGGSSRWNAEFSDGATVILRQWNIADTVQAAVAAAKRLIDSRSDSNPL